MKQRFRMIIVGTAGMLFSGCAILSSTPPEVAHIQLERVHSPVVLVEKVRLERKDGTLLVRGYVLKRLGMKDTTQTHLDVTLYDSYGTVLRQRVTHFEPRQIPRRVRRADSAVYRIELDALPPETTRLEIKAHEGNHNMNPDSAPTVPTSHL